VFNCGEFFLKKQFLRSLMPQTIYWMLVDTPQTPPEPREFLSPAELGKFSAFRFPKRRDEWLLGRWTAKLLAHSLPTFQRTSLDQIEIGNTPQGAPFIQLQDGSLPPVCLTISHSGHLAVCALTVDQGLHVGADLEKIEPRSEAFIRDYFTPAECRLVETVPIETRAEVVTLIWSAIESMLKALGVGLRWDTRSVEVRELGGILHGREQDGWQEIQVGEQKPAERTWSSWWQRRDTFILTLAGFAATQAEIQPVQLVEKRV
jgi:4'-phosphopantetheinyl transferase